MLNKIKSPLKKMLTILYEDNILSIRTMVFEKYTRKYISQAPFFIYKNYNYNSKRLLNSFLDNVRSYLSINSYLKKFK